MSEKNKEVPEWITKSSQFYEENYWLAFIQQQSNSPKFTITSSSKDTCRFCGKAEPDVTFRKEAHAFSESTGNKTIFVDYECDECNLEFGSTIETEFGNWSLVFRTVSQVRGKEGTSTVKRKHAGFRVEWAEQTQLSLTMREDFPWCVVDEERKEIRIEMPKEGYIPLSVYKAFVKMALMIMPEQHLEEFDEVIAWLGRRPPRDQSVELLLPTKLLQSFIPGVSPPGWLFAALAHRANDDLSLPYATFVLVFGNYAFQIVLPCKPEHQNDKVSITPFPMLLGMNSLRPVRPHVIDLSGTEKVGKETVPIVIGFESVSKTEHQGSDSRLGTLDESSSGAAET